MKMIFCVVLIIAAVCIAALVCYVVSGKVLQEKIKERDTKKAVLARKSKRWHKKALTPPTIEIVGGVKSVKKIREWHDNIIPIGTYVTTGKMKIKKDSKFKNLKLPKDCVRLTTTRQMVMEGNFQHNCVATYISKVNKDECSIWSQRKPDGTRNTIEIGIEHGKYCIIQMCAFANQEPMQKDLEKVQKAIDKCNDRRNKECLRKSV